LISNNSVLAKMMESYSLDDISKEVTKDTVKVENQVAAQGTGRKFLVSEDQAQGSVDLGVFWHYFEKCGGLYYVISFIIASLTGSALSIFSSLWLSWWSSNKYNLNQNTNMLVYGVLGAVQFCFSLFINITFLVGAYKAARYYHATALQNLLNSTIGFFDSQPVGRILNRLSKDIESMDQMLWMILFFAMFMLSQAVSTLIFLIYLDYRLSALVIPLTILYFFILKYYQKSNIEFKRFESSNKSPLYAHISETLSGLAAVKAFGVQKPFIAKQRRLMDFSNVPTFLRLLGFVWVSIRLQLLSSTVVLAMCILGISSNNDPALMGLAIS
jgi:ATP-binding cassette, subfamily C (CFTR/MRP), member 1